MPSAYQSHRKKWGKCRACPLHKTRKNVVLVRGKLPCDVLFIGEAPGASEDVLGSPFVGPAGQLLDDIVEDSISFIARCAFTNLLACIPIGKDEQGRRTKIKEPEKEHIAACNDRLREIVTIANPLLIVQVGKLSEKYATGKSTGSDVPTVSIYHPSAILRSDVSQQGLAIQRTKVILSDAYDEYVAGK